MNFGFKRFVNFASSLDEFRLLSFSHSLKLPAFRVKSYSQVSSCIAFQSRVSVVVIVIVVVDAASASSYSFMTFYLGLVMRQSSRLAPFACS
jgi:hypothetical protein